MHFPPKLQWYEYHLLITDAYNYIYETNSRPRLSFPIMHTGYQEKKMFFQVKLHSKDFRYMHGLSTKSEHVHLK